ncbi:WD40-repeat-containing domain protein [Earliella scabrosa]|nr:WD40-repeat-containing domain protein [Earliella scabrosa]
MSPSLPLEILELIVDFSQHDIDALQRIGRTCKALVARTRVHLFRVIRLQSHRQLEALLKVLHRNPALKLLVHHVVVELNPYAFLEPPTDYTPINLAPIRLLHQRELPNIQNWTFSEANISPPPGRYRGALVNVAPISLRCFARYASIWALHLESLRFSSCANFLRLLEAFPALLSLNCVNIHFEKRGAGCDLIRGRSSSRSQLQRLAVFATKGPTSNVEYLLALAPPSLVMLELRTTESDWVYAPRYIVDLRMLLLHIAMGLLDMFPMLISLLQQLATSSPALWHLNLNITGTDVSASKLVKAMSNKTSTNPFLDLLMSMRLQELVIDLNPQFSIRNKLLRAVFLPLYSQMNVDIRYSPALVHYPPHDDVVACLAISANSTLAASGSMDGTVILWDTRYHTVVREWLTAPITVLSLAFSSNSNHLLACGDGGRMTIWDITSDTKGPVVELRSLKSHELIHGTWSPDDTQIISAGRDPSSVEIWNATTFQHIQSLELGPFVNSEPFSLVFSHDASQLLACLTQGMVIWTSAQACDYGTTPHSTFGATLAFRSTGVAPMASPEEGLVHLMNIETGQKLITMMARHVSWFHRIPFTQGSVFSPDGTRTLQLGTGPAQVQNALTGEQLFTLDDVHDGCFSPDGKLIATRYWGGSAVKLWDAQLGVCIATYEEHTDIVNGVVFSPDGALLSYGRDGNVFIRHKHGMSPSFRHL